MAVSAEAAGRQYTYSDLASFPDDHLRREIIDGDLVVNPAPATRHQEAVVALAVRLFNYSRTNGGKALIAPYDVLFAADNVVEPDVLFVRSDHLSQIGNKYMEGPPDLVIEISSPSTMRLELIRKKELYERFGVPEYCYVDLEAERVEVYVLTAGRYAAPAFKYQGELLEPAGLPGLAVPVIAALAEEPPTEAS
ncbi:Uma2 family endonuclease [soil metagenome]